MYHIFNLRPYYSLQFSFSSSSDFQFDFPIPEEVSLLINIVPAGTTEDTLEIRTEAV